MEISQLNSKQRKRLQAILLKEDFRRLISGSGNAERYIIDTAGYTAVPNVVACFEQGNCWKVYETDDRSNVLGEETFSSALPAYQEAAARWGLTFHPSDIAKSITSPNPPRIDSDALHRAILQALNISKKIAFLLDGECSGQAAASDARFLESVLLKPMASVRRAAPNQGKKFKAAYSRGIRRTVEKIATPVAAKQFPVPQKKQVTMGKKRKDSFEKEFY